MGLLSAIAPFAGPVANIVGGLFGKSGQSSANEANERIAKDNRDFQERMSSTAYQRATNDLEKAGLNRILALGSPASSPGGSTATMQNENAPLAEGLGRGVSSAMAALQLKQDLKNKKAAERNTHADTALKMQQAKQVQSQDAQTQAATANTLLQNAGISTANQIAKLNEQITKLNIQGVKAESDFYLWLNSANASELAKTAGKAGPLALAFMRAFMLAYRR